MSKFKLVIFDMDGLLVDSEIHYSDGWQYGLTKEGINVSKKITDSWLGQGKQKSIDYLNNKIQNEEIVDRVVRHREDYIYDIIETDKMNEQSNATSTLKYLKEKGISIGVASSTHRERAELILTKLGLFEYVDYACFGDEVENVKPAPDIYNDVIDHFKYNKAEILAVEDSSTGVQAAKAAGLQVIMITDNEEEKKDVLNKEIKVTILKDLSNIFNFLT
ncbi:HAD family phosphatase [Erysipelothrix urinaevulpis]|uniref:HAD family hydrolase n=1 Tax=Erysipelothrix urinaevulpis TaxID=2683717 RepID=UPI00135B9A01|nr:HAD family phosphatase [Erysipelothrix urinaevulpis]